MCVCILVWCKFYITENIAELSELFKQVFLSGSKLFTISILYFDVLTNGAALSFPNIESLNFYYVEFRSKLSYFFYLLLITISFISIPNIIILFLLLLHLLFTIRCIFSVSLCVQCERIGVIFIRSRNNITGIIHTCVFCIILLDRNPRNVRFLHVVRLGDKSERML